VLSSFTLLKGINEDINRYITLGKRDLMAGMQEVSVLADKYKSLHQTSENLRRVAGKLRSESRVSFDAAHSKAEELERMHDTAVVLRQLRQFVHIKGQLDHHLKTPVGGDGTTEELDYDIRQMAAASRILNDLEVHMLNPKLSQIVCVVRARPDIERFGQYIRRSAQDILLKSVGDQDQASLSSALQVFFHLQALPDIVLLALDHTVRLVCDLIKEVVDVKALSSQFPELGGKGINKESKPAQSTASNKKERGSAQLRLALKELAFQFDAILFEYSARVSGLHQLLAQKEDPSSHERYMTVLLASSSSPFLRHSGNVVKVYWERLGTQLNEVFVDKLRAHPAAMVRLYPSLRRAALEVMHGFRATFARDAARTVAGASESALSGIASAADVFGCRLMSVSTNALGFGQTPVVRPKDPRAAASPAAREVDKRLTSAVETESEETGLVAGLLPCRDRYLLETLGRMSAPVGLMFPEVEGFTSAVPSKRDLVLLLTSIKTELVSLVLEGDISLIRLVSKEVVKVIRLLLGKLEGLVNSSAEIYRAVIVNGSCVRNPQQEHNFQIVVLLLALCESLAAMPVEVLKAAQDSGGKLSRTASANEAFKADCLDVLTSGADACITVLESHLASSLLVSMMAAIGGYVDSCLATLVSNESLPGEESLMRRGSGSGSLVDTSQCSRGLRVLSCALPLLLQTHLEAMPAGRLVSLALEEVCFRLIATFVSVSALARPVASTRPRVLADTVLLRRIVRGACPSLAQQLDSETPAHPALRELCAFETLMHMDSLPTPVNSPANLALLKSEHFSGRMRASTLLACLICMAPSQLPSPVEKVASPNAYLRLLAGTPLTSRDAAGISVFGTDAIAYQYSRDMESLPAQTEFWALVLQCLDILMQRSAVADASLRESMRLWYELIVDVGGLFFNSRPQGEERPKQLPP
jgi:hypothetical protein